MLVHRRQRLEVGQPRAHGEHALAREDQRALDERLDDLDLRRLQAVPEHDVARRQRDLAAALADELDALADELEADDLLGLVAHDREAAVAEERRRGAVDERELAEAPARDRALERARACGTSRGRRTRGASSARMSAQAAMPRAPGSPARRQRSAPPFGVTFRACSFGWQSLPSLLLLQPGSAPQC